MSMDSNPDQSQHLPANDNANPFRRPNTALAELYRLRRDLLAKDMTAGYTLGQWMERDETLRELDRGIAVCLSHL